VTRMGRLLGMALTAVALVLAGCSMTKFERAEIRAYPDQPTASNPHRDFQNRKDPDALIVDPVLAEAFYEEASITSASAAAAVDAPEDAINRALFLIPRGNGITTVMMFMSGIDSEEQLILWYNDSAASAPERVHELNDGSGSVDVDSGYPTVMQVAQWTARLVELWTQMMASAQPVDAGR